MIHPEQHEPLMKIFTRRKISIYHKCKSFGFTLVELMIAAAILGIIAFIAIPSYQDYGKRVEADQAIKDLVVIQFQIDDYTLNNGIAPISLADIGLGSMQDPWGNLYEYLPYAHNPPGFRRKDKNLNPLNTDYDLYSKGEDGQTNKQIITKKSQDDIIRGRDGSFLGFAKDF